MGYMILKMWMALAIAGAVGLVVGWLLRGFGGDARLEAEARLAEERARAGTIDVRLREARDRVAALEADLKVARAAAESCEAAKAGLLTGAEKSRTDHSWLLGRIAALEGELATLRHAA